MREVDSRGRQVRCGRPLGADLQRSDRTTHTDVCDRCAGVKLARFFGSSEGRAWLAHWRAVMSDLEALAREMGVRA